MCFWATYICVGEAREENKGDDSGCGRPPAVVAPPSPPSNLLALDPPIFVGRGLLFVPLHKSADLARQEQKKSRPTLANARGQS